MKRLTVSLLLALALTGIAQARSGNDDLDIDKVNGSIRVPDGATAGKLSTVNGGIHIGANAHAHSAGTVNGGIDVESGVTIDSLSTVNGGLHVGDNVKIAKTVEAVNGGISLGKGSDITGKASNVNGGIRLDAAHVGGGIETVSGDISIGADSRVEGGLVVNEDNSWFHTGSSRHPRIVIGPHAVVQGKLTFKREVDLFVSDSASIGQVEGATPVKFSGDQPPK
jgi:DUF4097 and DUF4098 domain-containing protein YvlB